MRSSALSALVISGCAPGWLISIKPPVAQRPLRRQDIPGRVVEQAQAPAQTSDRRRLASAARGRTERAMRVSSSIAAHSSNVALELAQPQPFREQDERRRMLGGLSFDHRRRQRHCLARRGARLAVAHCVLWRWQGGGARYRVFRLDQSLPK